jgi:hypothetical protein
VITATRLPSEVCATVTVCEEKHSTDLRHNFRNKPLRIWVICPAQSSHLADCSNQPSQGAGLLLTVLFGPSTLSTTACDKGAATVQFYTLGGLPALEA